MVVTSRLQTAGWGGRGGSTDEQKAPGPETSTPIPYKHDSMSVLCHGNCFDSNAELDTDNTCFVMFAAKYIIELWEEFVFLP